MGRRLNAGIRVTVFSNAIALAAALSLSAVTLAGSPASEASTPAPGSERETSFTESSSSRGHASDEARWVRRYGGDLDENAESLVVSPDGSRVFVTGGSDGLEYGEADYATVAYETDTGNAVWTARYNGTGDGSDYAASIAVSPDGSVVFVTGVSEGSERGSHYATVAYNARNGDTLWEKRYSDSDSSWTYALSIAVSHDGSAVFVTGSTDGQGDRDYATLAYESSTGGTLWVQRYDGPAGGEDVGVSIGVSPDDSAVFVTGTSDGVGAPATGEYATVAYDASTGGVLWTSRYGGVSNGWSGATGLAVGPDGRAVFVVGLAYRDNYSDLDYVTVAYSASTGALLWTKRHQDRGGHQSPSAIATSPDGGEVFVTGVSAESSSPNAPRDYSTIAYDASSGTTLWSARYGGGGNEYASSLVVSPNGSTVFVTGASEGSPFDMDYATLAYSASTGAQLWVRRHSGSTSGDYAEAIGVSPDSSTVFVTGSGWFPSTETDYLTIAYSTDPPTTDTDGDDDGVQNAGDNCPYAQNPDQADENGDGLGDACSDGDSDGDGLTDATEASTRTDPIDHDTDADGLWDSWEVDPSVAGAGFDIDRDGSVDATRDEVFGPYGTGRFGDESNDYRPSEPYSGLVSPPDPLHKDVYLELDWQDCSKDPHVCPEPLGFDDPMHHAPWLPGLRSTVAMFDRAPVSNPDGRDGITLHISVDEALRHETNCDTAASTDGGEHFGTPSMTDDAVSARRVAFRYVWSGHSTVYEESSRCPTPGSAEIVAISRGYAPLPRYDYTPFGDADVFGRDILISLGPAWICPTWVTTKGDGVCRSRGLDSGMFPATVRVKGERYLLIEPVQLGLANAAVGTPEVRDEKAVMRQLWSRALAHLLGHSLGMKSDDAVRNDPLVRPQGDNGLVIGRAPQLYRTWTDLYLAPPSDWNPAPAAFSPQRECTPWARRKEVIRPWPNSSHCPRRP